MANQTRVESAAALHKPLNGEGLLAMILLATRKAEHPKNTVIYARDGRKSGRTTGGFRPCAMDGCGGQRLGVRWQDGRITWPCTRGLEITKSGRIKLG